MLTGEQPNLSEMTGRTFRTRAADFYVQQGSLIDAAGIKLQVLHTPGHTPGGISLYSKDDGVVFTGDALFAGSVGRTDFPGGNMNELVAGIKERLFTLPDETVVYPGHGPATTIGQEKAHNPFVR
jgi:glyoxylase-like metal-dependent hydrolase (beta-lactamase superfamily II)